MFDNESPYHIAVLAAYALDSEGASVNELLHHIPVLAVFFLDHDM